MRAFIAIDIPDQIKEKIASIAGAFNGPGITIVKKEALHITMHFLGEISNEKVELAKRTLSAIKRDTFQVSIKGIKFFTPERIRVVFFDINNGKKQLKEIYSGLTEKLLENGVPFSKDKDYTPHITIARVKHLNSYEAFISKLNRYLDYDIGTFTAASIALKSSVLTSEGPMHTTLYEERF